MVNLSFLPLRVDLPQTLDEDREVGLATIDPLVCLLMPPPPAAAAPPGSNKRLSGDHQLQQQRTLESQVWAFALLNKLGEGS